MSDFLAGQSASPADLFETLAGERTRRELAQHSASRAAQHSAQHSGRFVACPSRTAQRPCGRFVACSFADHLPTVVCMLLRDSREIDAFDQTRGQYIVVPLCKPCSDRVLMCERSSFHEVYCDVSHDGELRLTYI